MKSAEQPLRVFISHSSGDQELARRLRDLVEDNFNTRVMLDEDISFGKQWASALRKMLIQCDLIVILLTPQSLRSGGVLPELGAAWALEKPILPIVTARHVLNNIPLPLASMNLLELSEADSPEARARFLEAFQQSVKTYHLAA